MKWVILAGLMALTGCQNEPIPVSSQWKVTGIATIEMHSADDSWIPMMICSSQWADCHPQISSERMAVEIVKMMNMTK